MLVYHQRLHDMTPNRMLLDVSVSSKITRHDSKQEDYTRRLHDMTPNRMLLDVSVLSKITRHDSKQDVVRC